MYLFTYIQLHLFFDFSFLGKEGLSDPPCCLLMAACVPSSSAKVYNFFAVSCSLLCLLTVLFN